MDHHRAQCQPGQLDRGRTGQQAVAAPAFCGGDGAGDGLAEGDIDGNDAEGDHIDDREGDGEAAQIRAAQHQRRRRDQQRAAIFADDQAGRQPQSLSDPLPPVAHPQRVIDQKGKDPTQQRPLDQRGHDLGQGEQRHYMPGLQRPARQPRRAQPQRQHGRAGQQPGQQPLPHRAKRRRVTPGHPRQRRGHHRHDDRQDHRRTHIHHQQQRHRNRNYQTSDQQAVEADEAGRLIGASLVQRRHQKAHRGRFDIQRQRDRSDLRHRDRMEHRARQFRLHKAHQQHRPDQRQNIGAHPRHHQQNGIDQPGAILAFDEFLQRCIIFWLRACGGRVSHGLARMRCRWRPAFGTIGSARIWWKQT